MNTTQRRTAALACAVLLGVAPAGCAAPIELPFQPPQPIPASSDPQQALAGALSGVDAGRYSWDLTFPGHHLAGAVDLPDHQAQWTVTSQDRSGDVTVQKRVIGTAEYVMTTGSGAPAGGGIVAEGTWEHFDLSRLPRSKDPLAQADIAGVTTIEHALIVTFTDGSVIQGSLNLATTGATPEQLTALEPWWTAGAGRATALLDAQGRLASLSAALPPGVTGQPAGELVLHLSGYDDKVPVAEPAPTTDAPARVYQTR